MVRLQDLMEFMSIQMDLISEVIFLMVHLKDLVNSSQGQEISNM